MHHHDFAPGSIECHDCKPSLLERVSKLLLIAVLLMAVGFSAAMALGHVVWMGWV